jgi:hypothetical protein
MPAHSSHLVQPLDLVCFSVLKRKYGAKVQQLMRNGVNHIDKEDFLEAYYAAHLETMSPDNIHSSFAAAGIVPYDPERVFSGLHTQLKTPTPPPTLAPEQGAWVPETPRNISQLELQTKAIREYIARRTKSPPSPTDAALTQLVKGCQMAMHSAVLLADENRQLRAENERQKRKSYIAAGGALTLQEGLELSQVATTEQESRVANQEATVQKHAPSKCSMCKSESHTARTCPTKQSSN